MPCRPDDAPPAESASSRRRPDRAVAIPGDYQYQALTQGFAVQRFWHRQKLRLIARVAPAAPGDRALDVGCGSGVVANALAEQDVSVDAVDCNERAIRFARQQFPNRNLRFHLALVNEMSFPDETFDRIYCLEVIEHLRPTQAADLLRTMRRLLRADGLLLLTTPNYLSAWPFIELGTDLLGFAPRMRHEQHVTPYRAGRLRAALAEAGMYPRRCGRLCGVAPFVSALSWRLAEWVDRLEWRLGNPAGNLLYAVCGRRP